MQRELGLVLRLVKSHSPQPLDTASWSPKSLGKHSGSLLAKGILSKALRVVKG